jgi:hypothetical protein
MLACFSLSGLGVEQVVLDDRWSSALIPDVALAVTLDVVQVKL